MLFKRKRISPEYLYLAIYTLQKKFYSGVTRSGVARFELEQYLSCNPLMLTGALNLLSARGWIRNIRRGSGLYKVSCVSEVPKLVDVSKPRIDPNDFGYEGV